jgi:hypothetical protein
MCMYCLFARTHTHPQFLNTHTQPYSTQNLSLTRFENLFKKHTTVGKKYA